MGLARRHLADVVGQQPLEVIGGAGALDVEAPHVAQVEHSRDRPHREVLVADRGVLLGQIPAAEVDHPPAEGDVLGVEGGPLSCCQTRSRRAGR